MKKSLKVFEKKAAALTAAAGVNTDAMAPLIAALASAMRSLAVANSEIDSLPRSTVEEITKYCVKVSEHPAFKAARAAEASIAATMKALGLTADLVTTGSDDPLIELTRALGEDSGGDEIIKPRRR